MSRNPFQKAVREGVKAKLLLFGKSGGGKTYTALALAHHMNPGGRIAVVCTERGSARRYAPNPAAGRSAYCQCEACRGHGLEFDFDLLELNAHRPQDYVDAMRAASAEGYDVIVLDSISHEWTACKEWVDEIKESERFGRNKSAPWSVVTPAHEAFLQEVRAYPGHVICTARAVERLDGSGNSTGILPEQRGKDAIFYEFDLVAYVWDSKGINGAKFLKARDTDSLQGKSYRRPGEAMAADLLAWAGEADPAALAEKRERDARAGEELANRREPESDLGVDFSQAPAGDQRVPLEPEAAKAIDEPEADKAIDGALKADAMALIDQLEGGLRERALKSLDLVLEADDVAKLGRLLKRVRESLSPSSETVPEDSSPSQQPGPGTAHSPPDDEAPAPASDTPPMPVGA